MRVRRLRSISATAALGLTAGMLALIPTAATAADASAPVVINEVYGGGGNAGATPQHDFIELYNASTAPVDLSAWSVQYASAAGTSWAVTRLTGTLPAGATYVVREGAGSNTAATPVIGDATGTIAMSGTSGKVALVNNATTLTSCGATVGSCSGLASVVDFVGYGAAATDYLGTPTATLSNSTSASRDASHTNRANNGLDFTAGSPSPCNLACSAVHPGP